MIAISLAELADVERCLEIRHAAFSHAAPAAYSDEQVAALLGRDERPTMSAMIAQQQMFVARVDDVVVGCGGRRDVNVYNLYVDPAAMRQGVGSALLAAIEKQFVANKGRNTLLIDAGVYTQPFYESCGYRVVERVVSSDGLEYLEMEKRVH
jgi:ribosomal protein S18 acetylase RimI-like enzyme